MTSICHLTLKTVVLKCNTRSFFLVVKQSQRTSNFSIWPTQGNKTISEKTGYSCTDIIDVRFHTATGLDDHGSPK